MAKKEQIDSELEQAKQIVKAQKERDERTKKCIEEVEKVLAKYGCMINISQPQLSIIAK